MDTMTVDQAKAAIGVKLDNELAAFFDVFPAAVNNWRRAGKLPRGRVAEIQLHRLRATHKRNGGRK